MSRISGKSKKSEQIKRFVIVTVGIFILTLSLHFFLIPSNLATGGVTGLALVLRAYWPNLPISGIVFVLNIILLFLGFIFIGKDFGAITIYCSIILSMFLRMWEIVFPNPSINGDLMLNLIYSVIIGGVGIAVVFFQNASTGGTDIIAKIINKYTYMDIGKSLFLSDALIVVMATITFGIERGLYSFLGLFLNSIIIDGAIARLSSKLNLMILTSKPEEVNAFINKVIDRGTTLFLAKGGFSNEDRIVINTVCNRKQYYDIKKNVSQIDLNAFIFSSQLNDVYGNGFTFFLD